MAGKRSGNGRSGDTVDAVRYRDPEEVILLHVEHKGFVTRRKKFLRLLFSAGFVVLRRRRNRVCTSQDQWNLCSH